MQEFVYTVKDKVGMHARPAGRLAKKAAEFSSSVAVEFNGKSADTRRLMSLMGLGIKCGDRIVVKTDGSDEDIAARELERFLTENNF